MYVLLLLDSNGKGELVFDEEGGEFKVLSDHDEVCVFPFVMLDVNRHNYKVMLYLSHQGEIHIFCSQFDVLVAQLEEDRLVSSSNMASTEWLPTSWISNGGDH